MDIQVKCFDDPRAFLTSAQEMLHADVVLHNLFLTIVEGRIAHPESGRYWLAFRENVAVGAALQSPLTYPATLIPMEPDVTVAIVDAIVDAGVQLPGVNGEAKTAATFAGRWTEQCRTGAVPSGGLRLLELIELQQPTAASGQLRLAVATDRKLVSAWLEEFLRETHSPANDTDSVIDAALSSERLWMWEDEDVVSMAIVSAPIQGVVRVWGVYTPAQYRQRGYAGACVYSVTKHWLSAGHRCILYTDLGNPISNAIYRRIGYRAVSEGIAYRFDGMA